MFHGCEWFDFSVSRKKFENVRIHIIGFSLYMVLARLFFGALIEMTQNQFVDGSQKINVVKKQAERRDLLRPTMKIHSFLDGVFIRRAIVRYHSFTLHNIEPCGPL